MALGSPWKNLIRPMGKIVGKWAWHPVSPIDNISFQMKLSLVYRYVSSIMLCIPANCLETRGVTANIRVDRGHLDLR